MAPRRWMAVAAGVVLVGLFYLGAVLITRNGFEWNREQNGYYNYLGRALASGSLSLPVQPNPELLKQPDPWAPGVDDSLKMHDLALFNGEYYLYHGAAPAVLLFAPWYKLTGRDLPEPFAVWVLCFGGYLFCCAALLRLFTAAGWPGSYLLFQFLVALGLSSGVPFLLGRVWVYEVAIAGGYFFVSAAVFFLTVALTAVHHARLYLACSGFLFGAATGSRPPLIFYAAAAAIALAAHAGFGRRLAAFLTPLSAVGIAIGLYNHARFGNFTEFGLRYLLTGAHQNQLGLSPGNWEAGAYFLLLAPPYFGAAFPWARMILRYPWDSPANAFPLHYFIEPIVGVLWLAPVIVCLVLLLRTSRDRPAVRTVLLACAAGSLAVFAFLISTHMATQRYMVDFLPLSLLAAGAAMALTTSRSAGPRRVALGVLFVTLLTAGIGTSLLLAITGPYDELRKAHPDRYVRLAARLCPSRASRPVLKPAIDIDFTATILPRPNGSREPLLAIGDGQYLLYVEHTHGKLRVVSQSESGIEEYPIDASPVAITVTYSPLTGHLSTALNGRDTFQHDLPALVAAPRQVKSGGNDVEYSVARRFTGRIEVHRNVFSVR